MVALKLLSTTNLRLRASDMDAFHIVKDMALMEGYQIQTDLATGYFYCIRKGQTRVLRIEEISSLKDSNDPSKAPDIEWVLK
jgi:hypothetical protein